MEIKSLFDKDAYQDILARIETLSPDSQRQWGKMTAAQAMAHCQRSLHVSISDKPVPRMFIGRLLGWAFKHKLYDEVPWKPGLLTAPDFRVTEERELETEKQRLIQMIRQFHEAGAAGIGKHPHPMFGMLTSEQWAKGMWKHINHHLLQFGV